MEFLAGERGAQQLDEVLVCGPVTGVAAPVVSADGEDVTGPAQGALIWEVGAVVMRRVVFPPVDLSVPGLRVEGEPVDAGHGLAVFDQPRRLRIPDDDGRLAGGDLDDVRGTRQCRHDVGAGLGLLSYRAGPR